MSFRGCRCSYHSPTFTLLKHDFLAFPVSSKFRCHEQSVTDHCRTTLLSSLLALQTLEMADPLSITASIIAVIGAAEGLSKTIAKIRNIQNAPSELLALTNEISDLRLVLGEVESYITQTQLQMPSEPLQTMSGLLERGKAYLSELEQIFQRRIVRSDSADQRSKMS